MRYALLLLVSLALLSCQKSANTSADPVAPTLHEVGGADGGGGDLPQSTELDVRSAVDAVMQRILKHALYNVALGREQITDAYVSEVIESFFTSTVGQKDWALSQPIFNDIAASPYYFEPTGGCADGAGHEHAGGVAARVQGSKICFSISKLRLIPKDDLQTQVLALAAHEFVHHFGFGELEATKFQTFIAHKASKIVYFTQDDVYVDIGKPLTLIAPVVAKDAYEFEVNYAIVAGKIIALNYETANSVRESKQPYCQLSVRWESGHPKDATITAHGMIVRYMNGSSSWSNGAGGITSIDYSINPVFNGSYSEATGLALYDAKNNKSDASVSGLSCYSDDLHVMDLSQIFGSLNVTPHLF